MTRRAAVLGSPIGHSLSPVLHRAAYEELGLDWAYEPIEVVEGGLAGFLASLDDDWAGLSLTMPLKVEAMRLADAVEGQAKLLGVVNTLLPSGKGAYRQWVGANTDVYGIVAALAEAGVASARSAVVIGGGATATSTLAALGQLGVKRPVLAVRRLATAGAAVRAVHALGLDLATVSLAAEELPSVLAAADVVVSTIPADAAAVIAADLAAAKVGTPGVLLDVVYHPLVSPLAELWLNGGGTHVSGVRMLLHQAAEQVRLMTGQPAPLGAMDRALASALSSR